MLQCRRLLFRVWISALKRRNRYYSENIQQLNIPKAKTLPQKHKASIHYSKICLYSKKPINFIYRFILKDLSREICLIQKLCRKFTITPKRILCSTWNWVSRSMQNELKSCADNDLAEHRSQGGYDTRDWRTLMMLHHHQHHTHTQECYERIQYPAVNQKLLHILFHHRTSLYKNPANEQLQLHRDVIWYTPNLKWLCILTVTDPVYISCTNIIVLSKRNEVGNAIKSLRSEKC